MSMEASVSLGPWGYAVQCSDVDPKQIEEAPLRKLHGLIQIMLNMLAPRLITICRFPTIRYPCPSMKD